VVRSTPRPHFTPGKYTVPILQVAGWAPGPVWRGGKSRPHRDSIPDRPAHSSFAISTELPGSHSNIKLHENPTACVVVSVWQTEAQSFASACHTDTTQTQPHQISNTRRTENVKTDVVIQQNSRKLLMMDILMSETC